jgi:hypothetical protein
MLSQVLPIAPNHRKKLICIVSMVGNASKCFAFLWGLKSFILVATKAGILEHRFREIPPCGLWAGDVN